MQLARNGKSRPHLLNANQAAKLYLALFFVVAALLQLFAFEHFSTLIANYQIPMLSSDFPLLAAMVIVTLEVIAIPRLLDMKLAPFVHTASTVAGWIILLVWFLIGFWQSTANFVIDNVGLFGAKISLPQGWWLVTYITILILLLGYIELETRSLRPLGYRKGK
jgi:hypothetical protein